MSYWGKPLPIANGIWLGLWDGGLDKDSRAIKGRSDDQLAVTHNLTLAAGHPPILKRTIHCLQCGKVDCELVTFYQVGADWPADPYFHPARHVVKVLGSGHVARVHVVDGELLTPLGSPEDARLAAEWLKAHPDLASAPIVGRPKDSGMLDDIPIDNIGAIYAELWKANIRPGKGDLCRALADRYFDGKPQLAPTEQTLMRRLKNPPDRLTWDAFCRRYKSKRKESSY
jgi:hypothetical protein